MTKRGRALFGSQCLCGRYSVYAICTLGDHSKYIIQGDLDEFTATALLTLLNGLSRRNRESLRAVLSEELDNGEPMT
jgi:hypothetical protein